MLMSNTGGGHRASAQALKAGFDELYPARFHIDIIDLITDYLHWPFNQIPKVYPYLSSRGTRFYKVLYGTGTDPVISNTLSQIGSRMSTKPVTAAFAHYQPDLIISVHPLMQLVGMLAEKRLPSRIPFATVVTDLTTAHPLWFHPEVDMTYVASEFTYQLALARGVAAERLRLFGLPIRPAFSRPAAPKPTLRQALGMDLELPAVLIVGGGEGVGPVEEIAATTAARLCSGGTPFGQLVVICGRNQSLQERLAARTWPIPAQIQGFVENMPDWMAACDCVVTKAGPGTIAEALISGLAIVLSGHIPGQEEGNVPFVVDNGVGEYSEEPEEIASIVARWFGPERATLAAKEAKAKSLGHPQATFDICRSIVESLLE
jgi:1,2-diacylglycerol 3-beta-galactosyltransferase